MTAIVPMPHTTMCLKRNGEPDDGETRAVPGSLWVLALKRSSLKVASLTGNAKKMGTGRLCPPPRERPRIKRQATAKAVWKRHGGWSLRDCFLRRAGKKPALTQAFDKY
ncbi:hypothetical protein [uncultured Desulfovibrio sp.]|uniref:hypothetical protein n=1 Tax=uncultured Desulfovibrio sp. TaxID=167968 RepID=UPI002711F323|nr:hypothetical protein [uncultured Desulfovibrio sp.]